MGVGQKQVQNPGKWKQKRKNLRSIGGVIVTHAPNEAHTHTCTLINQEGTPCEPQSKPG